MFPNIAMDMSGGSTVVLNVPANSDNSGNSSGSGGGGHQYYHHRGGAAAMVVDGQQQQQQQQQPPPLPPSRYESQKRRDWNTFGQYLRNHRPPLALSRCSGAHVLEFLRYLDQFGKTKVHGHGCPFFGHPHPPAPCPCPLRQAWGSLDALIGRLRAAFEENGGAPEANPFAARAVRLYLREVRDTQAKARGIAYDKKKRKRPPPPPPQPPPPPPMPTAILHGSSSGGGGFGPIMAAPTAGVANLQVTDLNSTDGFVMMHHPQYHLYHLYHHHGDHESTGTGSCDSTGSGGGVVMAAPDSHSGSLIPLSVPN